MAGEAPVAGPADTESNARLTSLAGVVLFVLLAALGVTILSIHRLLAAHAFLGFLLLGPLAVKLASTGWRLVRYYTNDVGYVRAGPPRPLLRVLAPLLVATTLLVFGSGVAFAFVAPGTARWLKPVHKASFIVWFVLTTVHVLAYGVRAFRTTGEDILGRGSPTVLSHRWARHGAILVSLVIGVALGIGALGWIHPWVHWFGTGHGGDG